MKKCLSLICCCVMLSSVDAQEASPIPPFTGDHLYVVGVPNTYEPLQNELRRLEQSSRQSYYVVVVDSAGSGKDATKNYADALYRNWLEQAARKGPPLDPDRSVIVVLAVANRGLSIHNGVKLRNEYGLNPSVLDQDIVRPVFLPFAKAGNYLEGLQALLPAIEKKIVAREAKQASPQPLQVVPAPAPLVSSPAPPAKQPESVVRPVPVVQQPETTRTEVRAQPLAASPPHTLNLPLLIGLAVAGLALVLGIARLRHIVNRRGVQTRFNDFRERVIDLRQRVESVKERHKLLPALNTNFQTSMAGATLESFNKVDADVRRLMDDWLARMDVWEKVQGLIAAESFFRSRHFNEAGRLLDQLGSFDEVDKACKGCVTSLDKLEQAHEQANSLFQAAEEKTARLREQMDAVARLGLTTAPYEKDRADCAERIAKGRTLLPADPLGAIAAAEDVTLRTETLSHRMEEVVRLFKRASEAQAALERATRLTAERRAGGLRLTEPDGNPDTPLEQGRTQHRDLLQALERGNPERAAANLERTLALADDAEKRIEKQAAARADCQKAIAARRSEADRLRQASAQAQNQRLELERGFAPESWREVADNSTRSAELQAKSNALLDEAAQAASDNTQHYFRAAGLLDQIKQQQAKSNELLPAVGQCLQRLTDLRRECERSRQEMTELARQAQGYLMAQQMIVRQPARSQMDTAEGRWQQVRNQANTPRPDWPAVQKLLDEAKKGYASALKQAEEDVRCHRQLGDRLAETERIGERVGNLLSKHQADRQQANQTYRSAIDALQRIRQELSGRQADWSQLLKRVDEAAAGLTKAEELARQDLQLADRAEAEIEEAGRQIAQAWGFSEGGISADAGRADQMLQQAHRLLGTQAYEQAIDQAKAAQQSARQAYDDAVNRVRQEQQQREAEQRRFAAAAMAASTAQSFAATNLSAAPPSPEPVATNWQPAYEPPATPEPAPPAQAETPPSESSQTTW